MVDSVVVMVDLSSKVVATNVVAGIVSGGKGKMRKALLGLPAQSLLMLRGEKAC